MERRRSEKSLRPGNGSYSLSVHTCTHAYSCTYTYETDSMHLIRSQRGGEGENEASRVARNACRHLRPTILGCARLAGFAVLVPARSIISQ